MKSQKSNSDDTVGLYDCQSRSDREVLTSMRDYRSELESLPDFARQIERLAAYYGILVDDPDDRAKESVLVPEEDLFNDVNAAYDDVVAEIERSNFEAAFWTLHEALSPKGRRLFWAPKVDYSNISDFVLPFIDDPDD